MQLWIVESCDSDESQIFVDAVPAENDDKARERVKQLRPYASICEAWRVEAYIERERKYLDSLVKTSVKEFEAAFAEAEAEVLEDAHPEDGHGPDGTSMGYSHAAGYPD